MAPERPMFHVKRPGTPSVQRAAQAVFGARYPLAEQYAALLAGPGVDRGLIGPREAGRLWERHLLNSAVLSELVPEGARVLDVGSGAGLPGIPLALVRPDLEIALLEPMARRVVWLQEVLTVLDLAIPVYRGRAEDPQVRAECGGNDVVTARAVAPLGRLADWSLPLVAPGGRLLAVKGASAEQEIAQDLDAVQAAGGASAEIVQCGTTIVQPPTTVIVVSRIVVSRPATGRASGPPRALRPPRTRTRKDR